MKVRHTIISFAASYFLGLYVFAQSAGGPQPEHMASRGSNRGIVVEKITKDSAGERAGLERGDTLLAWKRGEAGAGIESTFDLESLETEQAPQEPVTIWGVRGSEKRAWILGPDRWGIVARPNFPESLLALYVQCEDLAKAGKVTAAGQCWRRVSGEALNSGSELIQVWLLVHAAQTFAGVKQWQQADEAYKEAIQRVSGLSPAARIVLLRFFAKELQDQGEWDNAAAYYQQAADANQKPGIERLTTAASFDNLASLAMFVGNFIKVEDYSRKALVIQKKLAPSSLPVAVTLNNLGLAAWRRDDLAAAEDYHQEALAIRTKLVPGSLDVAESLNGLGLVAKARNDLDKCEEYHRKALEIREKLAPGSLYVAASLNNLGTVHYVRGDLAKAESYFRRALAIKETLTPGKLDIVTTLGNLGLISHLRGDLVKAEEYARQVLEIQEKLAPDSLELVDGYTNLGLIVAERDDLDGAEEYYRHALTIQQKLAPNAHGVAECLENLGSIERLRGRLAKADEYCRRALLIHEKLSPGGPDSATSLNCLGTVASDLNELQKAEQFYKQALAIRQKFSPDSLEVGFTLADLAIVADKRGDWDKAEEYARQAVEIENRLAPNTKEHAEVLATFAGILRHKQQPEAAAKLFEQAVNVLELQITRLGGGTEVRSEFRAREARYYKDYIDLLLQSNRVDIAFRVLERSRAQGLLETLAEVHLDILKGVDAQLIDKERSLKESIAIQSKRLVELLNGKHTQEQIAGINKEIEGFFKEYQDVEARIRERSPDYASLTQPQPLSISEVQGLLDRGTLLLEYALGEERSYVFAVTLNSIGVFPLPGRAEIEASARAVYDTIADPPLGGETDLRQGPSWAGTEQYEKALDKLSRMLLAPVAGLLNRKRLLIVSDGALQYIPFAVLLAPGQPSLPVIMEHETVSLPSASVLAVLRREFAERKAAPKAVAILADPVFDVHDDRLRQSSENHMRAPRELSNLSRQFGLERSAHDVGIARDGIFSRLPFTRREADAISSIAPRGDSYVALGFDASKASATDSRLRDYRIVHFATHGLLNSLHPELSGLVLSLVDRQGRIQDGFLRLLDIYNLNLNADLVVLSACQTALGKQIAEEGLVGLTRGFMYAGSARVLASLWKVDDEATAELMKKFYTGVLKDGQSPAQALRNAQIWISKQKQWRSPYYWAGFILQGEWQ